MNLSYVMVPNIIGLSAVAFLFSILKDNAFLSNKQRHIFILSGITNTSLIVLEILDYYFMIIHALPVLRNIVNFFIFTLSPIIPVAFLLLYKKSRIKRSYYLLFVINIIVCFISLFNNCVFGISLEGNYQRGVLFLVPIFISFYYLAILIYKTSKQGTRMNMGENHLLKSMFAVEIMCYILDIVLDFDFIVWNVVAVFSVIYYLYLQIQFYKIDSLSGVFNRTILNGRLQRDSFKSKMYALMIFDIDGLKTINDEQGHLAGDQVIRNSGQLLLDIFGKHAYIYRYGGDEFVLISESIQQFDLCIPYFKKEMLKRNLSLSYGICESFQGKDFKAAFEKADESMYAYKRSR